mmetsp:Transcript_744/g.2065  ORF Transcript_744/g.2065 Transcript_744/m.2065 type:complete len:193 (+) Transcript_744:755-1333(+)
MCGRRARALADATTNTLGRTCCCFLPCARDAGPVSLFFGVILVLGLWVLAVFPIRSCRARFPTTWYLHGAGTIAFFVAGEGLLLTIMFSCKGGGCGGLGVARSSTSLKCLSFALGFGSLFVGAFANGLAAQCMQSANVFLACAALERDAAAAAASTDDDWTAEVLARAAAAADAECSDDEAATEAVRLGPDA